MGLGLQHRTGTRAATSAANELESQGCGPERQSLLGPIGIATKVVDPLPHRSHNRYSDPEAYANSLA